MRRLKEKQLVITEDSLPAIVRSIDYEQNIVQITKFTMLMTIFVPITAVRHITEEERRYLTRIDKSKLYTVNQDRLIEYLENNKENPNA